MAAQEAASTIPLIVDQGVLLQYRVLVLSQYNVPFDGGALLSNLRSMAH